MRNTAPRFAIVIPMKDEADACTALLDGCADAVSTLAPFEICVTDDGSSDGTYEKLRAWADTRPDIAMTVLRHPTAAGQSAAVHSAVRAARAPIIVMLDGDGQNPPEELPNLLAPLLAEGADPKLGLVAGQRIKRADSASKRIASRLANGLRRTLLADGTRDTGCGLKAFRREAFLALPYFDHMHRYLPALFQRDGWTIAHVDVAHRERETGQSKYTNFGRALVGVSDLLGVAWLIRRKRRVLPREVERIELGSAPWRI
ncbi:MAG: glycosyltransferase family 2 protein [Pseudomonadota bacterium]